MGKLKLRYVAQIGIEDEIFMRFTGRIFPEVAELLRKMRED